MERHSVLCAEPIARLRQYSPESRRFVPQKPYRFRIQFDARGIIRAIWIMPNLDAKMHALKTLGSINVAERIPIHVPRCDCGAPRVRRQWVTTPLISSAGVIPMGLTMSLIDGVFLHAD